MRAKITWIALCRIVLSFVLVGCSAATTTAATLEPPSLSVDQPVADVPQPAMSSEPVDTTQFCLGDPTEKAACAEILAGLRSQYGIEILVRHVNFDPDADDYPFPGYGLEWSLNRARALKEQIDEVAAYFGGAEPFRRAFRMVSNEGAETGYELTFVLMTQPSFDFRSHWDARTKRINLATQFWIHQKTVIHEMGHAWAGLNGLEDTFLQAVGGSYASDSTYAWRSDLGHPFTAYGTTNHREDLAETFRVVVTTPVDESPNTSARAIFVQSHARATARFAETAEPQASR